MRRIKAFNFLTCNGFYKGVNEDTSWHFHGEEGNEYSEEQLKSGNILLFGRKTYEMMYSFWPTKMAAELYPFVAEKMNSSEKIVLSNSLTKAEWNNTSILNGNGIQKISELKSTKGNDFTILGSGSVITQLADAGLIDTYELMIDPFAIGNGTPFLNNIKRKLELRLSDTRIFRKSGIVLLTYQQI